MGENHNFADVYNLFFNPGEVVEIRVKGAKGKGPWDGFASNIVSGYFDNANDFARCADLLERNSVGKAIWFSLNPVIPDFKGRSLNRLIAAGKSDKTTSDTEILCLRWLPLDFDPVRIIAGEPHPSSDINTTEPELQASENARNQVYDFLRGQGAEIGIPAISGNGSHLSCRLPDLKPTSENIALIKNALEGIAHKFGSKFVTIDTTVHNPARMWKLYGTTARKSDHTPERPQRMSFIQLPPDIPLRLDSIPRNSVDFLRRQAALKPPEPTPAPVSKAPAKSHRYSSSDLPVLGKMNIEAYLDDYGVQYDIKQENSRNVYRIDCLFNPEHKSPEASIVQGTDGTITYYCFHKSCSGHTWAEARAIISGSEQIAKYCEGFDPDWKPSQDTVKPKAPSQKTVIIYDDDGNAVSGIKIGEDWDTSSFLYRTDKGRMCFIPGPAADYFIDHCSPLLYEGDEKNYWRYDKKTGVWKPFLFGVLDRWITESLGPYCKDAWVNHTRELIRKKTFRPSDQRNPHPGFLNLKNGMWDVEKMELVSHSPDFYSRVQMPVNYNDDAECPLWHKKIAEIMMPPDNNTEICKDKIEIIRQFAGYTFLPVLPAPAVIFAIGDGRNGKGVVDSILTAMLGEENTCSLDLQRMEVRFGISELRDKLMNSCTETPNTVMDSSMFKKAAAGDRIQTERKNDSDITFRPYAKHFIAMNHFPTFKERTNSLYRRITVVEFQQRFEGTADSTTLTDDLKAELDGIFFWALGGMYDMISQNYRIRTNAAVEEAKNRMKLNASTVMQFVEECCTVANQVQSFPKDVYKEYSKWCAEGNIHKKQIFGRNAFYEQILLSYPVTRKRHEHGSREMFFGLGMVSQEGK